MTKKHDLRHASDRSPTEYSGVDTSKAHVKAQDQPSAIKAGPPGDYYQLNYLERGAVEAPWGAHVALFPTREEADAKAEDMKARGALSVRVTPCFWGAK